MRRALNARLARHKAGKGVYTDQFCLVFLTLPTLRVMERQLVLRAIHCLESERTITKEENIKAT
jgi:hypothetical protein